MELVAAAVAVSVVVVVAVVAVVDTAIFSVSLNCFVCCQCMESKRQLSNTSYMVVVMMMVMLLVMAMTVPMTVYRLHDPRSNLEGAI